MVLADAAYGNEAAFRDWLSEQQFDYVLGIRVTTQVWWGAHQAAPVNPAARGRTRLLRDAQHQPIDVLALARALPAKQWRSLTWREGTNTPLRSRFARVRVRAAQANRPRAEEWLLIEWPANAPEPVHYWLSTLPQDTPFKALVSHAMGRWRIERDYQELKSGAGPESLRFPKGRSAPGRDIARPDGWFSKRAYSTAMMTRMAMIRPGK